MQSVLGLDIGEKRIGVAIAEPPIFIAHPIDTINALEEASEQLAKIIKDRDVEKIVIGLPRNLSGDETAQSLVVQELTKKLNIPDSIEVIWQDESLTSVKAEEELEARGKPFEKGDVDALAATYILEDYLREST